MVWLPDDVWEAQQRAKGKGKGKGKGSWQGGGNDMMSMMAAMAGKGNGKGMMMQLLGAMMGADMSGMSGMSSMSGGQESQQSSTVSWKGELQRAYGKEHKQAIAKETFVYVTEEADGGYASTLTCETFSKEYVGKGESKKKAEDDAAKKAVKGEFPKYAKAAQAQAKQVIGDWMKGSSWGAAEKEEVVAPSLQPWRAQLHTAFARNHKEKTKDSIAYSTEEAAGTESQHKQFVSCVSSDKFSKEYTGEPAKSKKGAEDNAAMVAMKAEFPEDYKLAKQVTPSTEKGLKKAMKRKREEEDADGEETGPGKEPKSRLNIAMTLLSTKPITKGSIEYSTTEEGGNSVGTVTITCLGPPKTYTGEAEAGTTKANKKQAEMNAATAALNGLKKQIAAAEEQHKAKKAAKAEESKAAWKVMLAKKTEEKKAEKEEKDAKKAKTA